MHRRTVIGVGLGLLTCALALASEPKVAAAPASNAAKPAEASKDDPNLVIEREQWLTVEPESDDFKPVKAAEAAYERREAGSLYPLIENGHPVRWRFRSSKEGGPTIAALRLEFSDKPPYAVSAKIFCKRLAAECIELRDLVKNMVAPDPETAALDNDWVRVVKHESCLAGRPVSMPAPRYPPEEQRRGVAGIVTLGILYNRCGDVRRVQILKSSGNRNIDRSAVSTANRWIVKPITDNIGGLAQTDISFSFP